MSDRYLDKMERLIHADHQVGELGSAESEALRDYLGLHARILLAAARLAEECNGVTPYSGKKKNAAWYAKRDAYRALAEGRGK